MEQDNSTCVSSFSVRVKLSTDCAGRSTLWFATYWSEIYVCYFLTCHLEGLPWALPSHAVNTAEFPKRVYASNFLPIPRQWFQPQTSCSIE